MKGLYRWAFKSRFRTGAYGWRGSALAGKRLKEAVGEITVVAKSDPVLAGEGIGSLLERLWPALQGIDTSSGALGRVVHRFESGCSSVESCELSVSRRCDARERLCCAVGRGSCFLKEEMRTPGRRNLHLSSAPGFALASVKAGEHSDYLSSQTSSMRQPLKMLMTIIVDPLTQGCRQVPPLA